MTYLVETSIIVKKKNSVEFEGIREFTFKSDSPIDSSKLFEIANVEAKKRWSTARVTNVWEA